MIDVEFTCHFPTPISTHVRVQTADGKIFEDVAAAYEHSKFLFMLNDLAAYFNLPVNASPEGTCMAILKEIARNGDTASVDAAYDRMLRIIATKGHG